MRLLLFFSLALAASAADFDLLIRNVRVIDGTGNPWFRADVAVKAGRIAAIGNLSGKTGEQTIDGKDRVLAPGFIDVHTHIEGAVELNPQAANFLYQGVTSVITGNCGGSRTDLAAWFKRLEEIKVGLNVGSLVGHNAVRRDVMGTANRKATAEEIKKMQAIVDQSMRDGAVGFSTGLIYVPGTYSDTPEVVALAQAAGKYNAVYASHMRDEGRKVKEAITEAVTVGKESGLRVQISHFKIDTPAIWGYSSQTIALVEQFRREGVDVVVDQYPYDHSSTNLGITLPSWALADGQPAIVERLKSPETRARITKEMLAQLATLGHKDYSYAIVASFRPNKDYEGKNIADIAKLERKPETETILNMIEQGGAQMVYHSMGDEDMERILKYPNTAIASDAGVRDFGAGMPHPRGYGTNPRVLAEYVRKRKVLTLEDAIRRMTSLPARTFNLKDRGHLREGFAADLVLFDPEKVQDTSTYQAPHAYAVGFDYVFVNGQAAVAEGKLTENRAGRILRHQP